MTSFSPAPFNATQALETFDTVRNLLLGISDPYMFHQANLRYFDTEDGNRHSLLSLWLEDVLRQLTKVQWQACRMGLGSTRGGGGGEGSEGHVFSGRAHKGSYVTRVFVHGH
jgi:hypothetical protein